MSSTRYLPIAAEGHKYHFFDRGRGKYVFGPIFIIFTTFTIFRIFTYVYNTPMLGNMYAGPQTNCSLLCSHILVLPLLFFIYSTYILFSSRSISPYYRFGLDQGHSQICWPWPRFQWWLQPSSNSLNMTNIDSWGQGLLNCVQFCYDTEVAPNLESNCLQIFMRP